MLDEERGDGVNKPAGFLTALQWGLVLLDEESALHVAALWRDRRARFNGASSC